MSEWAFESGPSRRGDATLWLSCGERRLAVHSPLDPRREARTLLAGLGVQQPAMLLLLGGGLGYLAEEASRGDWQGVLQLEPPRSGARIPGEQRPPSGVRLLHGTPMQLVDAITREQMERGYPDLYLVVNTAYRAAFPGWAAGLLEHFSPGLNPSRLGSLRTRSWQGRRVLVLQSGYFLLRECSRAFREQGCEVLEVPLSREGNRIAPTVVHQELKIDEDFLNRLLEKLGDFRPDLVFCVNHIGFDAEGRLAAILEKLRIPVAVWYVDSPVYILDGHHGVATGNTHLFVWERHWLPAMQQLPFGSVQWLPLAGNGEFATRGAAGSQRDCSFVGGSNVEAVSKWSIRLGLNTAQRREYERLLEDWVLNGRRIPVETFLEEQRLRIPLLASGLDERGWRTLQSLLVLEGTQRDRLDLVRAFAQRDFVVCGDRGWQNLEPALRLLPGLDYYGALPLHYGGCRVNLNSTSRQMPTALNQRAFDVPLCGSVVLGDAQEDLELLFTPGRDCLAWHTPEEALELSNRLLRDRPLWSRLARESRETVLSRHLYRHRVREILDTLKTTYSTPTGSRKDARPLEEPCRSS